MFRRKKKQVSGKSGEGKDQKNNSLANQEIQDLSVSQKEVPSLAESIQIPAEDLRSSRQVILYICSVLHSILYIYGVN